MAEINEEARKLQENLRGISGVPTLSTLAQKGDEKLVEQFLAEEVQVGGRENEKLQSQLYIACFWGFYDVVKSLIEKGADVNSQNKVTLWSPLHAATFQEHGKIVMFLLEKGANPELQDSQKRSPIDFASASDKIWPHFAALSCCRTQKQELVKKGIIKKVEEERPNSRTSSRPAAFSRPGSSYVYRADPFRSRNPITGEIPGISDTAAVSGDVLASSPGPPMGSDAGRVDQRPGSGSTQPALSLWRS